jgi:gamma-glutamyltranspeptidase/glutathione hydrolase
MSPPGLGFIFQDRGEMFVLKEGHANTFAPGKRPFHTIIPAFITKDGKPWVSFGLMGGGMQPQGHAEIVMNLIDFGMGLQEAGDAPRIQHEGTTEPTGQNTPMSDGGVVQLESQYPYATVRALMQKGHKVEFANGPYGGYQAILRDPRPACTTGRRSRGRTGRRRVTSGSGAGRFASLKFRTVIQLRLGAGRRTLAALRAPNDGSRGAAFHLSNHGGMT